MMTIKIKIIITWVLGLILLYCFVSLAENYSEHKMFVKANKVPSNAMLEKDAINKAKNFCELFNIECKGEVSFAAVPEQVGWGGWGLFIDRNILKQIHIENKTGQEYEYFGANVIFEDKASRRQARSTQSILFGIGRVSHDIESYRNLKVFNTLTQKYGWKKETKEFPRGRVNYPDFMPKEKAKEIIDSLSKKMGIPSDMTLADISKNEDYGLWNAIWFRKKDSYQYEGDGITMTIMGNTGDFIAYQKRYRGVKCPTDLKIDQNHAVQLAWRKLHWKNPWLIFWDAKDVYAVKAELRIVPVGRFLNNPNPYKFEKSRLAWIITFKFTGGLKFDEDKYFASRKTATDQPLFKKYLDEKKQIRKRMFFPESMFEVRVDAIDGSYIYADRVDTILSRLGSYVLD